MQRQEMTSNPRVIVTGGSSGIGHAAALVFAERGYDVAVTYRSGKDRADRVVEEIKAAEKTAFAAHVDFDRPAEAAAAIERLCEQMGSVDVLVNNAGVSPTVAYMQETLEGLTSTLNTNLVGPFLCAQVVAGQMMGRGGGVIVNVTSVLDNAPLAGKASYCSAKAGLAMLTRVMGLELARHSIRVVSVAPGHVATPMNFPGQDLSEPPSLPVVPMMRAASPREIAETIAFAASDQASYLTGANILADGGMLLVNGAQTLEEEAPHLDGPGYRP
jgi:NAD(P)-dependent dehydrogenase (short-subunit alcohol dehydrogenase family)